MSKLIRYFVEGECEKKFLKSFMYLDCDCFIEGKVEVLNFVNTKISKPFARSIKKDTRVVIITDTDAGDTTILDYNIETLINISLIPVENIVVVQSVKNFEEEIIYSCSQIHDINQLLSTKGKDEFKKKFIAHKDLVSKLHSVGFSINKIWSRKANPPFDKYNNDSQKIKKDGTLR